MLTHLSRDPLIFYFLPEHVHNFLYLKFQADYIAVTLLYIILNCYSEYNPE